MNPEKQPKVPYTLPKAEMHVHISLALSNGMFIRRVKKKRTPLTLDFVVDRVTRYYRDLGQFHGTYESMRHMTSTAQELADTTQQYLERIAQEGAIYAEISNSYREGGDFEWQMEAVVAGIEAARTNFGIETRIVVTTLRDHGPEKAEQAARFLVGFRSPYITAFGLVGNEASNRYPEFTRALHIAWHDAGLGLAPHVGEQHVHDAVDFLEAVPSEALVAHQHDMRRLRIGHGTLTHVSSELMREYADKKICLEVCLSSNKRIGLPEATQAVAPGDVVASTTGERRVVVDRPLRPYYEDVTQHPIHTFMEAGIPVCLGSDNPLLMNTNIGKEHSLAYEAGVCQLADQLQLTRNAIAHANVDPVTRARLARLVDDYEASAAAGPLPRSTALGYRKAFLD